MPSVLATLALAGAAVALTAVPGVRGWEQPEDVMGKTGGYPYTPTIDFWVDAHGNGDRTRDPPYTPPKDWIYNTNAGPVEGKINVHLVPHTHDDTGWQITVDQYFYQDVYYVIDTVVQRLADDPNRRFMYVETGFFARWWDQQPPRVKNLTKALVANGQLEFINGGWCMHDEASPLYTEMVDQTTRGHQFLKKHFGITPRGTWQIDPFGHSSTEAWLLGAQAGMESLFWGRTDYQDFNVRKNHSRLEWVWQGSQSLGAGAQVFAGELYGGGGGGYGTWIGFDGANNQVQDDPSRHDYNVDKLVDQFIQAALSQDAHTQTNHQMWACGSDFQYQNADHWYRNLDKLIHYVNQNGTVNAFYSTPSFYVDQKKKIKSKWELRMDDIFPLADNAHNYWSGYFTSRPALKRQVRVATNFLGAARQLEVISGVTAAEVDTPTTRPSPPVGESWTDSLEGTIGVATHHDGMSGTERQDVANDYEMRISESHVEAEVGVAKSVEKIAGFPEGTLGHCNCNAYGAEDCLNMTVCSMTTGKDEFTVVAWNPLGQSGSQSIRVPVTGASWTVTDAATGKAVAAQVSPIDDRTLQLPLLYLNKYKMSDAQQAAWKKQNSNKADHVLTMWVDLPAVGYSTFNVVHASSDAQAAPTAYPRTRSKEVGQETVSNGVYEITYDTSTGLLTSVTNVVSNITTDLSIQWGWYNSSVGGCTDGSTSPQCSPQKSGAYIFRPNSSTFFYPGDVQTPTIDVVQGDLVTEIRQTFSGWATHVIRLFKDQAFIEVEWTAGPIPIDTPWMPAVAAGEDNIWGKELVMRYSTSIKSAGTFYTDSNGREMIKRQYNARGPSYPPLNVTEPVAGNYYPVNSMIALDDGCAEMAVITDVSQGGASLNDGELELMVHRRVQDDDSRGVQEPLNETMCGCNDIGAMPGQMGAHGREGDGGCECEGLTMRGRHWLIIDTIENVNQARRQAIESLSFPATLVFADKVVKPTQASFSSVAAELPANVKLMTLTDNYKSINSGRTMLRFAHLYSVGEHPKLSLPATIELATIFSKAGLKIASAEETSVTGNQAPVSEKPQWDTFYPNSAVEKQINEFKPYETRTPFNPADPKLSVTLRPMELRTFYVTFE